MRWINLWLGKYHILSILDSLSPNPHVFLATHVKLNEYRVIKKISKANPFFKQLKKEAKFLSENNSEFLPRLYDVEEDNENLYLVEEYIQGRGLGSREFLNHKLKEDELLSVVSLLFDFLKFINSLEESVLYIDWKPDNIILSPKGLKIVDFGSVCYLKDSDGFTGLATEGFAAPELKSGEKLGSYTDIYGFGCIINYLAQNTESKKIWFFHTAKEKCIRLASRCTKKNISERPNIRVIGRAVGRLNKRHKFLKSDNTGLIGNINASKIGICGVSNGVGTTHIAFCIAKELADKGNRVAYVALDKGDGDNLLRLSYNLKNIKVYKDAYEEDITFFLKKGFDNLIIDFGKADEPSLLFHSCDEKIIVAQNNFIKGRELEEFLEEHRDYVGEKGWKIIDNLSDERQLESTKMLVRKMGLKIECNGMGMKRI
ncbi:MAG: protein kinase domain-containing protein [Catonella sp.]|uniref:protein kinase domain-containing protein n=1 Tax=Catonella sp. TaxID=2382125 RepID=UPI003F9EF944